MNFRKWPALGTIFLAGPLAGPPAALLGQAPESFAGQERSAEAQAVLTLEEAVALALEYHPTVGEAMAGEEVAASALDQARASKFPSLVTDASLARHQEPMLVAPLHGFDPTMAPSFDRNLLRGNLTLSYSLYDGGARGARIGRAEAGAAIAETGALASQMDLTAEVSAGYLELLSSGELVGAAESQRTALAAEEERVREFLAEGKAARVDLLRVQVSLSQAEAVEISLRSRLNVAEGRLARLTGLSRPEIRSRNLVPVSLTSNPGVDLSEAVSRARGTSPELALAGHQLVGAKEGVREARAKWYPTVHIAGGYSEFATLEGSSTLEWQGALQFSYPLFTGGSREAGREKAVAEERRVAESLRRMELAVEGRVEEALATVAETRARREALERAVEQAEEVSRIESLALEVGAGVQTDFLRAQAELFQARAALTETRHGEVMAGIQLARIMGELTPVWLQENTEVGR